MAAITQAAPNEFEGRRPQMPTSRYLGAHGGHTGSRCYQICIPQQWRCKASRVDGDASPDLNDLNDAARAAPIHLW